MQARTDIRISGGLERERGDKERREKLGGAVACALVEWPPTSCTLYDRADAERRYALASAP